MTAVERTIQNRRRYFEVDESEMAPDMEGLSVKGFARSITRERTDQRLRDEAGDGSSKPDERSQLFRESKGLFGCKYVSKLCRC